VRGQLYGGDLHCIHVIPNRMRMKNWSQAIMKMKKDEEGSMGGPVLWTTQKNNIMTVVFILQNCG
jgi:hypothetical protein